MKVIYTVAEELNSLELQNINYTQLATYLATIHKLTILCDELY